MPNRRELLVSLSPTLLVSIGGCITIDTSPDSESNSESNTEDNSESDTDPDLLEDAEDVDMEDLETNEETTEQEGTEEELEEGVDEAFEDIDTDITLIDQSSRRVVGGEYIYWEFELPGESGVDLRTTVRNGPNVDILVMTPSEFEQFKQGNRIRYFENISQQSTVGDDTSQTLISGNYIILINNNSNSTATVDIELIATG